MTLKRILGSKSKKHKTCLRCNQPIVGKLSDDITYICPCCKQGHYVDHYLENIALTVIEHPELRVVSIQSSIA